MGLVKKGQALVETALIAPVLIFLLLGVFEVGWALRGYLVLINATREAARFAARPYYLNYDEPSYLRVVDHMLGSISGQIEFTKTGSVIISVIQIETDRICEPDTECDCALAVLNPISPTLVMSPTTHPTLTYKYPSTSTEQTRIDYVEQVEDGVAFNRQFNCEYQNKGIPPVIDKWVMVETFYHQPQLFGFPLISNPFTDPVPMYERATFRVLEKVRG